MADPILKTFDGATRRIAAKGGLHMIRGNPKPHFSLTMSAAELNGTRWVDAGGGAAHDEILAIWPELKPLADLHLSDIDGVPMHAEANGWYWLAGSVDGGFGQRYHGGNSQPHRDAAECLRIFSEHVRISHQDAVDLRAEILGRVKCYGVGGARLAFTEWIEAQKPRWRAEADACIESLQLQVYGDQWVREAVPA